MRGYGYRSSFAAVWHADSNTKACWKRNLHEGCSTGTHVNNKVCCIVESNLLWRVQSADLPCRSCFVSSGKAFKAETYTSPIAMQSLLRSFGFHIASELAYKSLSSLKQAIGVLHSHLQSNLEGLLTLQLQLQVGFEIPGAVKYKSERHGLLLTLSTSLLETWSRIGYPMNMACMEGSHPFRIICA